MLHRFVLAGALLLGALATFPPLPAQESAPEASVGGPELPGGGRIACELPGELHRRNIGSPPPNGPGCCVFTSIHHAALWQGLPAVAEMPKWMVASGIPGGGYPAKVRTLIERVCKERAMPVPAYIQVEDSDLEIVKAACRSGRMVCSTYGISPTKRYGGQPINHMVNTVHADEGLFVVLDNNYPGANAYEHMTPADWLRAYRTVAGPTGRAIDNGQGWSVIFLGPPPPPLPN